MYFNENFSPSLRAKRYGYGFGGYPGFGGGYPGFGCCGYGTEVYIVYIFKFLQHCLLGGFGGYPGGFGGGVPFYGSGLGLGLYASSFMFGR